MSNMEFEKIKDYYEDYYNNNKESAFPNDFVRTSNILSKIISITPTGSYFLDIGCGVGFACEMLKHENFIPHGIDISEQAITLAKKKLPEFSFDIASIDNKLPYKNETFDRVICLGVLEHIKEPETIISETHRVLKKNGKALFLVPNSYSPYFLIAGGTEQIYEKPRTIKQWISMFNNSDFSIAFIGKDPGPTIQKSMSFIKKIKILVNRFISGISLHLAYQIVFIIQKEN